MLDYFTLAIPLQYMIAGIDFGSRYSGNTVVAVLDDAEQPIFLCSRRKQDADSFLMNILERHAEGLIAIDAPLTLPGVYRNLRGCSDYFYRQCDRELRAMSPMFLGGLTARAMRLKANLDSNTISIFEAYPAAAARQLHLGEYGYKTERKALDACVGQLALHSSFEIDRAAVPTWHHFDALLALWVEIRIRSGTAMQAGDPDEGLIYF
jgi:predicted nuclease with RNAse H fold